jgi:hypothetical protein
MNIYIYGSKSFKKDINKLLSKANVVFKLEDSGTISEINSVEDLKGTITQSPRDIFLIDENKIIKKGGVEFLKPKDGIERSFLNKYGVGDLSVDTFDDLVEHINERIELKQSQNEDLSTSIKSIDIDNIGNTDINDKSSSQEDTHLNIDKIIDIDDIDDIENENIDNNEDNNEDLININDILDDEIEDEINDEIKEDNMSDDIDDLNINDMDIDDMEGLDELDNLDESLLMDALGNNEEIDLDSNTNSDIDSNSDLTLNPSQLSALTDVLSKLLNGKELQITIKVK